jgi:hypothetical protein
LGIIDIPPIKILPTWRNMRTGDARVAKILDHFLVHESLFDYPLQLKQWIDSGGDSDHYPIWLELDFGPKKPAIPFKFNTTWLEDEDFQNLVKENWMAFDPAVDPPATVQFVENIKRIKKLTLTWASEKHTREDAELRQLKPSLIISPN